MTNPPAPLVPLQHDVAALATAWSGALPAFGFIPADAQGEIELMNDAGLVGVTDAIAQLRRDADALMVRVAAEVGRRSGPEFGTDGLAKKNGFHNPTRLVASSTGGSAGEAARFIAVGAATAARQGFSGASRPARHPHVAAQLESGCISLDAAGAITTMLDSVALRADADATDRIEKVLAERAAELPLHLLMRAIKQAEAQLDPDGAEPRDEQRWLDRSVTIREDRNGMIHFIARLDPESAAALKAAIEAIVSDGLRAKHACDDARATSGAAAEAEPVVDDNRSIPQRQADALIEIARHALGCAETLAPLASVTAITRIDLEALRTGLGLGTIDGIDQPVSAGTIRRMAASADLIPIVLGTASLPLDVGRKARRFSRAQRIALTERDGGCASCGQNISYTHAHHIRWWKRDRGPTDISNGVMLCSFCHHMIHRDGWGIRADRDEVWFIPPPHVDPDRIPRHGGKARFNLPNWEAA